jgi:acyl-CoA synthetase (AMP-forming)/AMP-acid ligase II
VVRPVDAPALVSWSTGSTGRPHPVVRSHGVLVAQHEAIRRLRTPRPDDVDLVGLPTLALHDLACGIAMVLPPRIAAGLDPARLRTIAGVTGATLAAGFPTLFERLVDGAAPNSLPSLRSIHVGGAPVRRDLLERLALVAPNADVVVVYGSTEVEPIAAVHASELLASVAPPGSGLLVGRIQDGLELKFAPSADCGSHAGEAAAPPARGRILVRGARVARAGDCTDADGWLDTGDVGAMDDDHRLWLLGRASNGSAAGHYPAEIEEPTLALDEIGAAALVTLAGGAGPRSVLVVEPASAASPIELVRERVVTEARDRGWALDRVVVVRRLPRDTGSGKLDYSRIRTLTK